MKAYLFHDETMGAKYDIEEIPADLLEQCKKMRMELLEELATIDESNEVFMMKVLENPDRSQKTKSMQSSAKGLSRIRSIPFSAEPPLKTKAFNRSSMRLSVGCHLLLIAA